jgi:collagen type VII alpha
MSCNDIINSGSIIPCGDLVYSLGTTANRWESIHVGGGSIYLGHPVTGAVLGTTAGVSGEDVFVTGGLVPTASLTYSLGTTSQRWKEAFIGPGSVNLGGAGGVDATIGADNAGIVYTQNGFATPTVIVGPSPGLTGSVGGWFIGVTGTPLTANYDLFAQENVATVGGGLTGPTYSLIKHVVRSITADTGIVVTAGPSGTTVGLAPTGVTVGTYINPIVDVNVYGQITSITDGSSSGSTGPTGPTGPPGPTGAPGATATSIYNLTKLTAGITLSNVARPITSTVTSITESGASIVVMSNVVASNIDNNKYLYTYIGITGPGITAGTSGATSDTSAFKSHEGNAWLQNVVMHDYLTPQNGTYYITVYAWHNDTATNAVVQNSHILVFGNMTKSP